MRLCTWAAFPMVLEYRVYVAIAVRAAFHAHLAAGQNRWPSGSGRATADPSGLFPVNRTDGSPGEGSASLARAASFSRHGYAFFRD